MQKRRVIAERPTVVQHDCTGKTALILPDWPIYNAPRPLYGTVTWQGDFVSGIFYAAIDPEDGFGHDMEDQNLALDARVLEYLTEDEAVAMARTYYADNPHWAGLLATYEAEHAPAVVRELLLGKFYQHFAIPQEK